jgi:AbrB family looped-hinge helix DNA binding protein
MRITSKGQVTIPAGIREKAGLMPNTEVEFSYERDGTVRLFRATKQRKSPTRGERLIAHLRAHSGDVKMTTDEIMKLTRGDPD